MSGNIKFKSVILPAPKVTNCLFPSVKSTSVSLALYVGVSRSNPTAQPSNSTCPSALIFKCAIAPAASTVLRTVTPEPWVTISK